MDLKKYDEIANENILSSKNVIKYKNQIEQKKEKIKNLKVYKSLLSKILHPITLVKANKSLKNLDSINDGFEKIMNTPIIEFVKDETGDVEEDFKNAAIYVKPNCIWYYMAANPIEEAVLVKKLKK